MRAHVEVFVQLKPGMLDPQGETLEHALDSMGYAGISEMRVGKWITFAVEGEARGEIEDRVDEMCRRLLANPVIETYRWEISEVDESAPAAQEGAAGGAAPAGAAGAADSSVGAEGSS